jgi:hypothetical protein
VGRGHAPVTHISLASITYRRKKIRRKRRRGICLRKKSKHYSSSSVRRGLK